MGEPVEDLVLVLPVGEVFERDRTLNEISDHPLYCLVVLWIDWVGAVNMEARVGPTHHFLYDQGRNLFGLE